MKKLLQKKFLIPIFILVFVLGYYLVLPAFIVLEKNEEISFEKPGNSELQDPKQKNIQGQPEILSQNDFQKAAYDVKGQALVLQQNNQRILRFENFETINGPSLNIYLVNSKNKDIYHDLGPIKATKGNVNYQIPESLDLNQYDQVQVYCVPFKKVFSYASL
ncbi:hypothetical protein CL656_03100 [bacterium]|nr:hypothetical protein [bacterium]|tara:strand:- start:9830 stop:10315 length:486 start_codon:yes stop_codon:yes gene_type:complete